MASSKIITLPPLQKLFVNIFFVFAWEFCIENGGVFGEFFLVSVSHETKHENSSNNPKPGGNRGAEDKRKHAETQTARVERRKLCYLPRGPKDKKKNSRFRSGIEIFKRPISD